MADVQMKLTILPDNPLCGIGTYKDILNLATGACTWRIKELVFDGTENWALQSVNQHGIANYILQAAIFSPITYNTFWFCSHLMMQRSLIAETQDEGIFINAERSCYLRFFQERFSTVDSMKNWLASQYANGTPVCVWYVLATPETETIHVPAGLSGIEEGYLNQDGTPTPTNPIYPTANNVDVWYHSLRKLGTSTDTITTLPVDIYADGNNATVGLKGNTVQNGTPTPDNPIQPSECGDRTGNLLTQNYVHSGLNWSDGTISNVITDSRLTTMDFSDMTSGQVTAAAYDANSNSYDGVLLEYDSSGNYTGNYQEWHTLPYTWTVGSNKKVRVCIKRSDNSDIDANNTKIMLNTGSTAKPYEPYGYKLTISSGGVTTNIYLGSTQTVRQIKKIVFDGTEQGWGKNTGLMNSNAFSISMPNWIGNRKIGYCTHYQNVTDAQAAEGIFFGNSLNILTALADGLDNTTKFKQWLSTQYANGTPVAIWYVLATPETGIVNEPIRKIGDYADTVSGIIIPTITGKDTFDVETTLKPSEVSLSYTGWHNANVKEFDGTDWN